MSTNPYAAPKAAVADEPVPQGNTFRAARSVPASNGWNWIADGWTLFKAAPGLWIGMIVVFFVVYLAAMLVPFIGPVAQYLADAGVLRRHRRGLPGDRRRQRPAVQPPVRRLPDQVRHAGGRSARSISPASSRSW